MRRPRGPRRLRSILPALLWAALAVASQGAFAQPAELVEDIVPPGTLAQDFVRFPQPAVELAGRLYFLADDGIHGQEMWSTAGTAESTRLLRDICPGACSGVGEAFAVVHGGLLYFAAYDGVHGTELWRSDGTEEGTVLVSDTVPGLPSGGARWLTPLGSKLLFTARAPSRGDFELRATDGTSTGSQLVASFPPIAFGLPASFVTWKEIAYFVALDADHGAELWRSDGTPGGTHLVRDIRPGPQGSMGADSTSLTRLWTPVVGNDRLLFAADDGVHGLELWRSDGTEAGTELVLDIHPGFSGSQVRELTPFGDAVFFAATDLAAGVELWRTDGTAAGTVRVADIAPGPQSSAPAQLTATDHQLFFTASTPTEGTELWKTDGTAAGTQRVADIFPGPEGSLDWTFVMRFGANGDRLLFAANDGVHGQEPWVSDGTTAGTRLLADVNPGGDSAFNPFSHPLLSGVLDGRWIFFAEDDEVGWEPWRSDGTPEGTAPLRDLDRQTSAFPRDFFLRFVEMVDAAGTLFFTADDRRHGFELWRSDGTAAGTVLVADSVTGDEQGDVFFGLTSLGSDVFYARPVAPFSPSRLWKSDGTPGGTAPVVTPGTDGEPLDVWQLPRFGDALFFNARDALHPQGVWRSDGTAEGTARFPPTAGLGAAQTFEAAGDTLFLVFATGLWASDGDPAGTTGKLTAIEVEARALDGAETLLFFAGDDGTSGAELWVSDGTPAGTRRVRDVRPGAAGSIEPGLFAGTTWRRPPADGPPIAAVPGRDTAFFVADDGTHGAELWWSDATEGGTFLLRDIAPGPRPSGVRYLTLVRGVAYFVADDGERGAELWRSDGTPDGTFLLTDIEPGAGSSLPASLTEVFGHLVFSAWRFGEGRELWRSDGTPGGTVRWQDINPGKGSSSPFGFTLSGPRLFFAATDGERGFEPWAVPATPPHLRASMTVSGQPIPGGTVVYSLELVNGGTFAQLDNPGPEVEGLLPAELELLALASSSGTVASEVLPAGLGIRWTWDGSVPGQGAVILTIRARIRSGVAAGTLITQQPLVHFDADGSGDNETTIPSDDPSRAGGEDPTELSVMPVEPIPATSRPGAALLGVLLAAAALFLLRR